jgi:multicomponent K+:H+ antiporter subunit D
MMMHGPILPVVIPLILSFAAALQSKERMWTKRLTSFVAVGLTLGASVALMLQTGPGELFVYELGNWQAPFGIVLVADQLSTMMVTLTSTLAFFVLLYAIKWGDELGEYFHFFFLVQIAGVNGAFLTGDIFNLFVFFEVLLIASYNLLIHGGGKERVGASLHYVIYNLTGSGFFIMALAVIYGLTGTLNMADLAVEVAQMPAEDAALLRAGGLLLLVVFAIKGAILPLYFWLPRAYSAASAPVAAFFAIMTKIGVYAILRVSTLIFNQPNTIVEQLTDPWLIPAGIATLVAGGIGAYAAKQLQTMIAYLVIWSVGTIIAVMGVFTPEAIGAALYYLVHSTLITALFFLLAGIIRRQRGDLGAKLRNGPSVNQTTLLGLLFFAGAVAFAGLPPSSGFLGKVLMLDATTQTPWAVWIWSGVLIMGLFVVIAFARAGSTLFWKTTSDPEPQAESNTIPVLAVFGLLACVIGITLYADPVFDYTLDIGRQLMAPQSYIDTVLRR